MKCSELTVVPSLPSSKRSRGNLSSELWVLTPHWCRRYYHPYHLKHFSVFLKVTEINYSINCPSLLVMYLLWTARSSKPDLSTGMSKMCIFNNETLCTCVFHFCTFHSCSRPNHDVKWSVLLLFWRRKHSSINSMNKVHAKQVAEMRFPNLMIWEYFLFHYSLWISVEKALRYVNLLLSQFPHNEVGLRVSERLFHCTRVHQKVNLPAFPLPLKTIGEVYSPISPSLSLWSKSSACLSSSSSDESDKWLSGSGTWDSLGSSASCWHDPLRARDAVVDIGSSCVSLTTPSPSDRSGNWSRKFRREKKEFLQNTLLEKQQEWKRALKAWSLWLPKGALSR